MQDVGVQRTDTQCECRMLGYRELTPNVSRMQSEGGGLRFEIFSRKSLACFRYDGICVTSDSGVCGHEIPGTFPTKLKQHAPKESAPMHAGPYAELLEIEAQEKEAQVVAKQKSLASS